MTGDAIDASAAIDAGLAHAPLTLAGRPQVFRTRYRARFDEVGPDGLARTSSLLRWAQDVAWQHSDDRGFDRAWYAARGLAWVVRAVEVEVLDGLPMGEVVELATGVVGHRRVWARRLSEVRRADARLAARVATDWVLLDAEGRPVRIPAGFDAAFAMPPAAGPLLRVELPPTPPGPGGVDRAEIAVRPTELDPLGHVNNAVYADWFEDRLRSMAPAPRGLAGEGGESVAAAGAIPRRLRIEYATSVGAGASVVLTTWPVAAGWAHRQADAGGRDLARAVLRVAPPGEAPER